MTKELRLVLFGPPGAGKGTQAQLLCDRWHVAHVSSGDLFRWNLQNQTPLGLKAAEFMNQGLLVPDEVTIDIVLEKVLTLPVKDGFILDGFPRNTSQAVALEKSLQEHSRALDKVVHMDLAENELVRRLGGRYSCRQCQTPHNVDLIPRIGGRQGTSSGQDLKCQQCGEDLYQRADDTPEAVKRRIEIYHQETMPILEFYRSRSLLVDVDAMGTIKEINKRILLAVDV